VEVCWEILIKALKEVKLRQCISVRRMFRLMKFCPKVVNVIVYPDLTSEAEGRQDH
jgi:hypothetical protein